jgi:hypothetical protein
MARYEDYDQNQQFFIVLDQKTNYPEGCCPRFLNDFIEKEVDLNVFAAKRNNDLFGALAKHAKMMHKGTHKNPSCTLKRYWYMMGFTITVPGASSKNKVFRGATRLSFMRFL